MVASPNNGLTEFAPIRDTSGDHTDSVRSVNSNLETRPRLPVYVRFADLAAANIVRSWPQLIRLIENENFPRGVRLSPNSRAWEIGEVQTWLASRPPAGQGGAGVHAASADPEKLGLRSQREGSGRARPFGKPRRAPCGSDPSKQGGAAHDC